MEQEEFFIKGCKDGCEDKEVITYCKKCDCVYAVNQNDGTRTELNMTIKELIEFIAQKEKEGYTE